MLQRGVDQRVYPGAVWAVGDAEGIRLTGAAGLLDPAAAQQPAGFGEDWVRESLQIHTGDLDGGRGLFWYPAPGTRPADDTWVHYGFTGTGMWISPKRQRWATLLTNKLYYTRDREPLAAVRNHLRQAVFA